MEVDRLLKRRLMYFVDVCIEIYITQRISMEIQSNKVEFG